MITIGRLLTRLERQAQAWSDVAPDDEFAGLTLAGFRLEIKALQGSREELVRVYTQAKAAAKARRMAEQKAMRASKHVALSMKSHPAHGDDSPLVRASGFLTEADRKSGLSRRSNTVSTPSETAKA